MARACASGVGYLVHVRHAKEKSRHCLAVWGRVVRWPQVARRGIVNHSFENCCTLGLYASVRLCPHLTIRCVVSLQPRLMRGTDGREGEVDIECMGASRGLLVGFGVGLCLAILRFGPTEVVWQHAAAPTHQPLRSLEPLQPSELVAPVQRDAPAAAPTRTVAPRPPLPPIAACVGGALSLVVPGRGSSVRLGVLEPLGWPDVFVAGTLNGSVADEADAPRWAARARAALASIEAVGPFVATSVVRQLTREEIAEQMRGSPAWKQYEVQIGRGGDGRLRPEDTDPRLWLPTMLSPALGNPSGNVLRETVLPEPLLTRTLALALALAPPPALVRAPAHTLTLSLSLTLTRSTRAAATT